MIFLNKYDKNHKKLFISRLGSYVDLVIFNGTVINKLTS